MIVYGTKQKEIAKEFITDKCAHCKSINCIDIHVSQKYAHVFWVPFFPMKKLCYSHCEKCGETIVFNEMVSPLKESAEEVKKMTKAPVWMFSGLVLMLVFIIYGVIIEHRKEVKNKQLVIQPQKGDLYEIKEHVSQYTIYKVDQVEADSVFFNICNFETDRISGLKNLKTKAFSEDVLGISKADLSTMLKKGEIIDIERK